MSDEAKSETSILLVDDNPTNLQVLFKTLKDLGPKLLIAKNGKDALGIVQKAKPSLVLLDVMMPEMDGYETCQELKNDPATRDVVVIFLSALGEVKDKVKGLELGAVDFITKPFQAEEVIARVRTQLDLHQLRQELQDRNESLNHELRVAQDLIKEAQKQQEGPLLGESIAVKGLKESIASIAATDDSVLLTGANGSGEEAVARAIHAESSRGNRPFIYVNCALLKTSDSSTLLGSTLGESEVSAGKFELAHGGTLYLDRVDELSLEVQERLLTAMEKVETEREAGHAPRPDVRVISFTSQDLSHEVQALRFNLQLSHLLGQRQLGIPPLAERREDIAVLAEFYVQQHARRLGKIVEGLSDASLERLQGYPWPGNIRELRNVLEREVVVTQSPVLEIEESLLEEGVSLGGYRLIEKLGEGGMGEVWRAKHQLLARPAAVKLIRSDPSITNDNAQNTIKRFQREAQATANLCSPNTIRLYDFGVSENGSFYYVMELLDGIDLNAMVKKFGPMPAERVVYILRQACRSLGEAHDAGLVHRDVKPDNIFVCRQGPEHDFVKILDFGIVKIVAGAEKTRLTGDSQSMVGSPGYISPEVILAESEPDGRADLYSLGCVAYLLLTGQQVFESENVMRVMMDHAQAIPNPPSSVTRNDIPSQLEDVLMGCLAKSPDDRPASARALWEALGKIELAPPWTELEAEHWWKEHVPEAVPRSDTQGPTSMIVNTSAETIGFDDPPHPFGE